MVLGCLDAWSFIGLDDNDAADEEKEDDEID